MSSDRPPSSFDRTEAERGRLGKRHSRGKRWRRKMMIGALVLGGAYGLASMAYPVIKGWRGERFARQSMEALATGNIADAQKMVRSAIRLAPHEPAVVRAAARFSTKVRNPETFKYWQELADTPSFSDQDRLEFIRAALILDRLDLAQRYLHPLLAKEPRNREVLRLVVLEQTEFQNYPKAIEAARLALSLDPSSDQDLVSLGRLLIRSTTPSDHDEGKNLLWDIGIGKSPLSLEAITAMIDSKSLTTTELEVLLRRVQAEAITNNAQKMLEAGIESRLHPERRDAAIDRVLAGYEGAPVDTKSEMLRWAVKLDPAHTAEFLNADRIGTNRTLVTIKAEALASSAQWSHLDSMLTNAAVPFEPSGRALLKARSAFGQGKTDAGRGYILEGINLANPDPRALILLAKTAETAGLPADAIRAWERLGENPALILQASREVMRLSVATADLPSARRTIQRLSDHMPGDNSLAAERAILDVLYGENLEAAISTLGGLVRKNPGNIAWRHGLALARLKSGDAPAALSLIEETAYDWKLYPPRSQAIYIAILGSNGQRETARRFAHQVRIEKLREPERQLIEPWL